jgi:hypothetical protein
MWPTNWMKRYSTFNPPREVHLAFKLQTWWATHSVPLLKWRCTAAIGPLPNAVHVPRRSRVASRRFQVKTRSKSRDNNKIMARASSSLHKVPSNFFIEILEIKYTNTILRLRFPKVYPPQCHL